MASGLSVSRACRHPLPRLWQLVGGEEVAHDLMVVQLGCVDNFVSMRPVHRCHVHPSCEVQTRPSKHMDGGDTGTRTRFKCHQTEPQRLKVGTRMFTCLVREVSWSSVSVVSSSEILLGAPVKLWRFSNLICKCYVVTFKSTHSVSTHLDFVQTRGY